MRAGNLPSLAAELVARDGEIAALRDLLVRHRLVEIVGPGGIGKTALAIATGRTLVDVPVWLVRLEAAQTADDVLDTVVAALGVVGGEAALQERLRRTEAVLILDNCEHVVDAAAALAERLLDAAPTLRVLCTSQVPLELADEAVFELAPLTLDDAVELFALRSARPGDPEQVRELCRSLDGLPLAIELAAARTRTLSVEEIARRLDDRFTVLSDPASRKPERRRALRATIGWSYDLLFPDDQRGLWALATFPGGASLAAAESVLGALDVPSEAAIDVVSRLASRSLVIVDEPPRYRLLDSIRAFALEALAEAGLTERGFDAHAAWYAEQAASSTEGVRSAQQAEHLAFARAERANIDAALAWCAAHDPVRGLELANGFGWAWIVLGDARGAQRLLAALAAAGDDGAGARAGDRAPARRLDRGVLGPPRARPPAHRRRDRARGRRPRPGGPLRLLPRLRRLAQRRVGAGAGAHRPGAAAVRRARPPVGPGGERALRRPRGDLGRRPRPRRAGTRPGSAVARARRRPLAPRPPRRHARRARTRRAPLRRRRHAHRPGRRDITAARLPADRGVPAHEPRTRAVSGRGLRVRRGDAGARDRQGRGHRRRPARRARPRPSRPDPARTRARAPRPGPRSRRRRRSTGPPAAASSRCSATRSSPRSTATASSLAALLERARRDGDAPAEVFALDALARLTGDDDLYAAADARMDAASHFITERDRVDRRAG